MNLSEIADRIGKAKNHIYRVGIELEGGWVKLPTPTTRLVHDGSVQFQSRPPIDPFERTRRRLAADEGIRLPDPPAPPAGGPRHIGELPSFPLEAEGAKKGDPAPWIEWVRQSYPSHVNETCGLHVHYSFKSAIVYQRIMTPDYMKAILAYIRKWAEKENLAKDHPIWQRLTGTNTYCRDKFWADQQARATSKNMGRRGDEENANRYTVINYCYSLHSTAECRLLPMMETADQAIRAIQEVLNITNAFVSTGAKKEPHIHADVVIDDDSHREEIKECV